MGGSTILLVLEKDPQKHIPRLGWKYCKYCKYCTPTGWVVDNWCLYPYRGYRKLFFSLLPSLPFPISFYPFFCMFLSSLCFIFQMKSQSLPSVQFSHSFPRSPDGNCPQPPLTGRTLTYFWNLPPKPIWNIQFLTNLTSALIHPDHSAMITTTTDGAGLRKPIHNQWKFVHVFQKRKKKKAHPSDALKGGAPRQSDFSEGKLN